MRKLWLVVVMVVPALVPGCGSSSNPCVPDPNSSSACPPIEGSYAMSYSGETDSNGCNGTSAMGLEVPPMSITLTRQGADLKATINSASLQGQVFDDSQFTLHGNGGVDISQDGGTVGHEVDFNIRGRFMLGASDAGGTITGTWETTAVDVDCDRQSSFSGLKQQ